MNDTTPQTQTSEDTEHTDERPAAEAEMVEPGIPPEIVGNTTDLVSKDWTGSGHSGPDDQWIDDREEEHEKDEQAAELP
jgi:hypothetical protein